jgi:hypothetical protein
MYINQSSMYTARISVWWGTDPWLSHCRRCEHATNGQVRRLTGNRKLNELDEMHNVGHFVSLQFASLRRCNRLIQFLL